MCLMLRFVNSSLGCHISYNLVSTAEISISWIIGIDFGVLTLGSYLPFGNSQTLVSSFSSYINGSYESGIFP